MPILVALLLSCYKGKVRHVQVALDPRSGKSSPVSHDVASPAVRHIAPVVPEGHGGRMQGCTLSSVH